MGFWPLFFGPFQMLVEDGSGYRQKQVVAAEISLG